MSVMGSDPQHKVEMNAGILWSMAKAEHFISLMLGALFQEGDIKSIAANIAIKRTMNIPRLCSTGPSNRNPFCPFHIRV